MRREEQVIAWMNRQARPSVWTTSVSVYETRFGIELLASGRRRRGLEEIFGRFIKEALDHRVLTFDLSAAEAAGAIAAKQRRTGRPVEVRDVLIAGIVAAQKATLATHNTRHFAGIGLPLVDPSSR